LTFDGKTKQVISRLCSRAKPLAGTFFRSTEYRYMDAASLLGGHGTELYGGRFVPIGLRAVYFSASDAAASQEVTARKKRLGGDSQISLDKYPRIVYAVDVRIERCVALLRKQRSPLLERLRRAALLTGNLVPSQELGMALYNEHVEGILFPSVVGVGTNLAVFVDYCKPDTFRVVNENELKKKLQEVVRRR